MSNKDKMTHEQQLISSVNHRKARKHFNLKKGYVLHHKDETLIDKNIDRYIQWKVEDLEVMSKSEHSKYHSNKNPYWKGKKMPKQVVDKISKSMLGNQYAKGYRFTDEQRQYLSNVCSGIKNGFYGKQHSNETKLRISIKNKGKHWYTNGVDNKLTKICPEGYWLGRTVKR